MTHDSVTLVAEGSQTAAAAGSSPTRGEANLLRAGEQLGRYVVLERIGSGGMGTVYSAFDPELDRKIAVKVLTTRFTGDTRGDNGARRLQREAQALARLQHPNVIPIYDVGNYDGRVYLAMAFVDGQTLGEWAQQEERSIDEVLDVLEQAGRGLSAAHACGLVHRDFKPDNVMIDRGGCVFVMDFGLARTNDEEPLEASADAAVSTHGGTSSRNSSVTLSERLTRAGAAAGTPAYMAPEQHLAQDLDPRTDQFSLCVTLWEILFGQRPFGSGADGGPLGFGLRVIEGKIAAPPESSKVPAHIKTALERGLRPLGNDRWPSIDALFTALRDDPRARWRRRALVGSASLIAVLAVGSWRLDRAADIARCGAESEQITARWADARNEIAEAFAASAEDGEEQFSVAEPWVQRWVERASKAHSKHCLAELEGGETQRAGAVLALACVDERLDEFTALIDIWREADPLIVRKSVSSATRLPDLANCGDRAWLARRPLPPSGEAVRARISKLRRALSEVSALSAAGRYDAGLAAVEALVPEAEAIAWDPLTTDVLHKRAEFVQRTGDYKAAAKDLAGVYRRAVVNGDDDVALDILGRLIPILAYHLSEPAEAGWWAQQAETLILRLGERGKLRDASIQFAIGTVAHMDGDSATALTRYEKSLEIYERVLGPTHPNTIGLTNNVGLIHEQAERHEEALQAYRAARQGFVGLYGEEHPDVGTATNNIGSILLALGRHEDALETYEDALRIRRLTLGENHPEVAATLHNLAITASKMNTPEESLAFHRQALAVRERVFGPEHPQTAASLDAIGNTLRSLGRHQDSLEHHTRSLTIRREHHGPEHESVAQSYQGLAYAYLELGRKHEALAAAENAVRIKEAAEVGAARRAHAYATRSEVHAALHHDNEALADAESCLALRTNALGPDHTDTVGARERVEALRATAAGQ
jgi:serine/threonine protein kinase/Tfp pilus assembly protein PilF